MYGSQTGAAKSIAETIHSNLSTKGYAATLGSLNDYGSVGFLTDATVSRLVIIVCSTTGDGDPPNNADDFYRFIRKRTHPKDYFTSVHYTCLGLGDTNYDKFCAASKTIVKRLNELGAKSFYPPGYADEAIGLETVVDPWLTKLYPAIQTYYASLASSSSSMLVPTPTTTVTTDSTATVPPTVPSTVSSTDNVPLPASSSTSTSASSILPHISIPTAIEHIEHNSHMNELSPMTFMKATQAIQEERVKRRKSSVEMIPSDITVASAHHPPDSTASSTILSNNHTTDTSNNNQDNNHSPTVVHLHPQAVPARIRSRGNSAESSVLSATMYTTNNDIVLDTNGKTNDQIIEEAALIAAASQTTVANPPLPPLHIPPSLSTSSLNGMDLLPRNVPSTESSSSSPSTVGLTTVLPYLNITPTLTPGVKSFIQLFPNITVPPATESMSKKLFPALPKNILNIKTLDKDTTALINAAVELSSTAAVSSSSSSSTAATNTVHTPPGTANNTVLSPTGFPFTVSRVPRVPSGIGLATAGSNGSTTNSGHNSPGRSSSSGTGTHPVIGRSIDAPIQGSIEKVKYLTTGNHTSNRRVIHMEINVENTPLVGNWHPGDSISILTPNPDDLCFGLCARLNLDPFHRVEITEAAAVGTINTSPDAAANKGIMVNTVSSSSSSSSTASTESNDLHPSGTLSPPSSSLSTALPVSSSSSPSLQPSYPHHVPSSPTVAAVPLMGTPVTTRIPIYLPHWLSGYPYPTIIDIFRWCVDLTSPPKKNVLRLLGEYCLSNENYSLQQALEDKNLLMYLASTNGKTAFQTLIEEQRLTFLDILLLFPSSLPPFATLLSIFPPLAPRSYSLASSPLENRNIMAIAFTVVHYECMASTLLMNKGTGSSSTSGTTPTNQANGIIATTMMDNMPTPTPLPDDNDGPSTAVSSDRLTIHRKGIATSYLEHISLPYLQGTATLSVDHRPKLRLFLRPARDFFPPVSLQTPLIMIGPGTGVAPFRGFLQHRAAMIKRQLHDAVAICRGIYKPGLFINDVTDTDILKTTYLGNSLLFFGNRSPDIDYLYKEELQQYLLPLTRITSGNGKDTNGNSNGTPVFTYTTEPVPLTNSVTVLSALYTAWSRQKSNDGTINNKVYVQHRLKEQGAIIADLILHRGAHIYVCGDGMQMAKDVHQTLVDVLVQYGGNTKSTGNDTTSSSSSNSSSNNSSTVGNGVTTNKAPELWTPALAEEKLQKLTKEGRYAKDVWA